MSAIVANAFVIILCIKYLVVSIFLSVLIYKIFED